MFYVHTDHGNRAWLKNFTDSIGRLARWALQLQEYDFEILHRPYSSNGNQTGQKSSTPGNLKGNIKNALSSLRILKNILPQSKLDQVYKALLESHLRFNDELWGSLSKTKLDHLQRLQNRARTLIESSRLKDGWISNWLSVSNLIIFDRAVMIYKIMNGLCQDNLRGRLVTRSQISKYRTRNKLDFETPSSR